MVQTPLTRVGQVVVLDPIPARLAGRSVLDRDMVYRRLGRPASKLWEALRGLRDTSGTVRVSQEAMGRAAHMSTRQVETALKRLREAGLLEQEGWRKLPRSGRRRSGIYERTVRGAVGTCPVRGIVILVPKRTELWLMQANEHGGKRQGAGRKPKSRTENQEGATRNQVGAKSAPETPQIGNQEGASYYIENKENKETESNVSFKKETFAAAPPPFVSSGEAGTLLGAAPREQRSWLEWAALPGRFDGRLAPPYPGASLIGLACVPSPPTLPPDADETARVTLIARAYEGALEARYGVRSWAFRRGDITRSRYYPLLAAAAAAFAEHDIAPAAWVAFSLDVWAHTGKNDTSKSPPLTWIFSAARITKQRGWFRQETAAYSGGQTRMSGAHRELIRRHALMQQALMGARTEAEARAVVDRIFPGDLWDTLLSQAQAAVREAQHQLNMRASRGDWLWD